MEYLRTALEGNVALIAMARPKANALNAAMIDELNTAVVRAASNDEVRAVVLASDCAGFFSAGFDAKEVFAYDRPAMRDFWQGFHQLHQRLFTMPKPVVAAVPGHAYAGGAVLAMACDLRIFAQGNFGFAISGVNIGIALPYSVMQIAINAMGPHQARRLFLTGDRIGFDRAFAIGLAHEEVPAKEVQEVALTRARGLGEKSPEAFGQIKTMFNRATHLVEPGTEEPMEAFLDQWFGAEAEGHRKRLLAQLESAAGS